MLICINFTEAADKNSVRILSYNIHHGAGMDRKIDLARIAKVIQSVSPDLVSLQEVDNQTQRSQKVDQAKELARLTGMNFVYGSSLDYQGGQYGNAILSKLPIKDSKVIPLPGEPRSALCVTVSLEDSQNEFLFIATHLDTKSKPRKRSVPLIEVIFKDTPNIPAILAGDLNAIPGSTTMKELEKNWVNSTSEENFFTYPVRKPNQQIDYILHRPTTSWKVTKTQVLEEKVASDHRPILAELTFIPNEK